MSKLNLIKSAVGFVCGAGISNILVGIIEKNVVTETKFQKGSVYAARLALTAVLTDIVKVHTDAKIDQAIAWYQKTMNETKNKAQS